MVAVFRDQDLGKESRSGEPTGNWPHGRWYLDDGLAIIAAPLRAHVTNDLEGRRHVLQYLGDILAEVGERATTVRAGAGRRMNLLFPRQVLWQRLAGRLPPRRRCTGQLTLRRISLLALKFLNGEFELIDLVVELFGGAAEPQAPQAREFQLELLKFKFPVGEALPKGLGFRLTLAQQRPESGNIGRQFLGPGGILLHAAIISKTQQRRAFQAAVSGVCVRLGKRQSMPSSSMDNCAGDRRTVPFSACGQMKRPRSNRL